MLDPIQNAALRIVTGAFRSSPSSSLHVEASEIPLLVKRKILALKYYSKIISNPNHPLNNFFSSSNNQIFPHNALNTRLSFPNRCLQYIAHPNLTPFPNVMKQYPQQVEPWLLPIPTVKNNHFSRSLPPIITLKKFNQFKTNHHNWNFIFTDGSKTVEGVGTAVVSDNHTLLYSLQPYCSVYTAELFGINHTVCNIPINCPRSVICSDSESALKSLQDPFSTHPLIIELKQHLKTLTKMGCRVLFLWLPGHCGITGNEKADSQARLAIKTGQVVTSSICKDVISGIKEIGWQEWQDEWFTMRDNKLRMVQQTVKRPTRNLNLLRREDVVLTRLRIGHTRLTHGHLMKKENAPTCRYCGNDLTVRHILTECIAHEPHRFSSDLQEMLSEDPTKITKLFHFLKIINIYDHI
ncbi:uncharacterized protein [Halyomorpha halys]|uniref:uncharacterized protein n=1 Tax=Halyomorpha halys TaxID=286706 RepID=UPI0034D19F4A